MNDTNTLNGALTELGELMAQNLTTQGLIGVSASDGLTTLANAILDIQGGGGSTVIFEDKCDSSSGLSNYDTIILGEGSSTSYSMTYDSTMNAYQLSHSNNNTKSLVINDLINEDEFTLELEFYYPTSASTNIFHTGIAITNNTSYFTGVGTMYDNAWKFETVNYSNKSWVGHQDAQTISDPKGQWNKLSITVQGLSVSAKMTIGSTEYTFTKTLNSNLSSSSRQFGISFVSATSSVAYIRNIKAERLGGGSTVLYQPTLDGTENWYKINSSYTPTFSTDSGVNQVCDACGYLTTGWDNTIDWKLTFEYYYTYHQWGDHGALVTFDNVTARDRNSLQFWGSALINHQGTGSATIINNDRTVLVDSSWNTIEITKDGSSLAIVVNSTNTYNVTNTDFSDSSRTKCVIGLDKTGTNNTSCIRNIKVETIGSPYSPCSEYQTQIENAIIYINGSGN